MDFVAISVVSYGELDTLMVPTRSCFVRARSTPVMAHPPVDPSRSAWYHD